MVLNWKKVERPERRNDEEKLIQARTAPVGAVHTR